MSDDESSLDRSSLVGRYLFGDSSSVTSECSTSTVKPNEPKQESPKFRSKSEDSSRIYHDSSGQNDQPLSPGTTRIRTKQIEHGVRIHNVIVSEQTRRVDEKQELNELNSRLDQLVEAVRNKKNHNDQIQEQINKYRQEFLYSSNDHQKRTLNEDLEMSKGELNRISEVSTMAKIRASRSMYELDRLKEKYDEEIRWQSRDHEKIRLLETQRAESLHELNYLKENCETKKKSLLDDSDRNETLRSQLNNISNSLDREQESRIDLECQVQTLLERKKFDQELHRVMREELEKLFLNQGANRAIDPMGFYTRELREIKEKIRQDFMKLSEFNQDSMREEYEYKYTKIVEEYETKKKQAEEARLKAEYEEKSSFDSLSIELERNKDEIKNLKLQEFNLNKLLEELQNKLNEVRNRNFESSESKQKEIDLLHEQINNLKADLSSMLSFSKSLDSEVAVYARLLNQRMNSFVTQTYTFENYENLVFRDDEVIINEQSRLMEQNELKRKQQELEENNRRLKELEEQRRRQKELDELQRLKREREEEERRRKQREKEEEERRQREYEELLRQQREEEERRRREYEEQIRIQREYEEKIRIQREEEERIRRLHEEEERLRRQREEEERLRRQREEEVERLRLQKIQKEEEERLRRQKEEEERRKREYEEQLRIQKEYEERNRRQRIEEEERRRRESEEQIRIQREYEEKIRKQKIEEEERRRQREYDEQLLIQERIRQQENERLRREEQLRIQREYEEQLRIQETIRQQKEQERLKREEQIRIQREYEEQLRIQEKIRQQQENERLRREEQIRIQREYEEKIHREEEIKRQIEYEEKLRIQHEIEEKMRRQKETEEKMAKMQREIEEERRRQKELEDKRRQKEIDDQIRRQETTKFQNYVVINTEFDAKYQEQQRLERELKLKKEREEHERYILEKLRQEQELIEVQRRQKIQQEQQRVRTPQPIDNVTTYTKHIVEENHKSREIFEERRYNSSNGHYEKQINIPINPTSHRSQSHTNLANNNNNIIHKNIIITNVNRSQSPPQNRILIHNGSMSDLSKVESNSNKYAIKHKANRYVSGAIGILETSLSGEYIILENLSSNKSVNLKGWYIHRFVPDQNINVTFKFVNDTILNPGEKLKILSNRQKSNSMHEGLNRPPRPLVKGAEKVITAFNIENWGTYSKFSVTKLINQEGVDKAVLTQSLLKLASSQNNLNQDEIPLPEGSELSRHARNTSRSSSNLNEFGQQQMIRARSGSRPCCPETTTTTTTKKTTTTTSTTQQTTTTTTKNCCPDQQILVTSKPPIVHVTRQF